MIERKKILYISKDRHPLDIRTEKITESLRDFGYDVAILCRWYPGDSEDNYNGIKLFRAGKGFVPFSQPVPYNPIWCWAIKKSIKKFKPDLIIVREIMLAIDAAKYASKFQIPIIMDMAENYPVVMKGWNKYKSNFLIRYLVHDLNIPTKIESKSVPLMDGIITVCQEQCYRLTTDYQYPEQKMQIIHNTPYKDWFIDVKRGMLVKPCVFAYHGLINSERNLENLIYAFNEAWKSVNYIKLFIAGYGELEDSLKQLANSLDCRENIEFKGRFVHGQIKNLYSEMDFGVLPYKLDEHIHQTISNKYFDYMGAGKPMITSLALPMIRMNQETGAGISVDCDNISELTDTILQFVNDANYDSLNKMSESALMAFKCHYSWDRDFSRLQLFIEEYLSSNA